jgi:hypothetical protein
MAVVQQLANILSTAPHELEPALCDGPQFTGMFVHPRVDPRIVPDRTWEAQELAHGDWMPSSPCDATVHHFENYSGFRKDFVQRKTGKPLRS